MITDAERKQLLLERIESLRFFVEKSTGSPNNPVVTLSLYLVLQVDCTPRVALYRHARYLLIEWLAGQRNGVKFWARHYWLRYGRRMSREEVIALYEEELKDLLSLGGFIR